MPPITPFALLFLLMAQAPPTEFAVSERALSEIPTSTIFRAAVNERDTFLGEPRCVVCGVEGHALDHEHIILQSEKNTVRPYV